MRIKLSCCVFFLVYAHSVLSIGSREAFTLETEPPWETDGRQDSDWLSVRFSIKWFVLHAPRIETQQKFPGVLGWVPVQSTQAYAVPTYLKSVKPYICWFLIEDLRIDPPTGEVRHRDGGMKCPEGWECVVENRDSLRLPNAQGLRGDHPRQAAYCADPKAREPQQEVKAYSGDCLDSELIKGRARYIAARVSQNKKRGPRRTTSVPYAKIKKDKPFRKSKESLAYNTVELGTMEELQVLLTIVDKDEPRNVHREVNRNQISMDAQDGHMYKACLENGSDQDLVLQFFSGVILGSKL